MANFQHNKANINDEVSKEVYPIQLFYLLMNLPFPVFKAISRYDIPDPQRHLLVHHSSMTIKLEKFFKSYICLDVLNKFHHKSNFYREVRLVLKTGKPIAICAIKINLSLFSNDVAREIMKCEEPLGVILKDSHIKFTCHPKCYFYVKSDQNFSKKLNIDRNHLLFGRVNKINNMDNETMVNVVEILA